MWHFIEQHQWNVQLLLMEHLQSCLNIVSQLFLVYREIVLREPVAVQNWSRQGSLWGQRREGEEEGKHSVYSVGITNCSLIKWEKRNTIPLKHFPNIDRKMKRTSINSSSFTFCFSSQYFSTDIIMVLLLSWVFMPLHPCCTHHLPFDYSFLPLHVELADRVWHKWNCFWGHFSLTSHTLHKRSTSLVSPTFTCTTCAV